MYGSLYCLQADLGKEIHALSSASKPLAGWIARDAIQECREACGGHGYFKGIVPLQYYSLLFKRTVYHIHKTGGGGLDNTAFYPLGHIVPLRNHFIREIS